MKTAYKKAMDQVAVSDHMRTRILAAARPKNRYGWVKTACGAAACFALLCTVGLAGLQGMENSKLALPETAAKFGAADAKESSTAADAVAEGAYDALADTDGGKTSHSYSTKETAMEDAFDGSANAGTKSEPDPDTAAPEDTPDVLIANPLAKYAYLEDALDVLEFTPVVPAEAINGDVTVIGGEVLQLCWEENGISYTYRTALGDADVSGIYTVRDYTETAMLDSCDITFPVEFSGDGNTFSLALWQRDGMTFSLFADPGVDMDVLIGIIE